MTIASSQANINVVISISLFYCSEQTYDKDGTLSSSQQRNNTPTDTLLYIETALLALMGVGSDSENKRSSGNLKTIYYVAMLYFDF